MPKKTPTAKNINKVLVVSPHPDDLDFGCAGTVAKWSREGKDVVYCIVTDGSRGIPKGDHTREEIVEVRKAEQMNAANTVGVEDVIFLEFEDGEAENTKQLRRELVAVIRKVKPDAVLSIDLANHNFDNFYRFHRDHRQVAEAVFDAVYPAAGSPHFFEDLEDDGFEPHQITDLWFFGTDTPNKYIDISDVLDKKVKALKAHESQLENPAAMEKRIREWAQNIGKEGDMEYAESFRVISL